MQTLRHGGILSGRVLGGVGRGVSAPAGGGVPRRQVPKGFFGNAEDYARFQKASGMSANMSEERELQEETANLIAQLENAVKSLKAAHGRRDLSECQKQLGVLYSVPAQYGTYLEQLLAR